MPLLAPATTQTGWTFLIAHPTATAPHLQPGILQVVGEPGL